MFIYRSLYYSVIAASGKGSSLLRVLSSLQKLLLSQRRDSRLNNHFSIAVTMWEQLFASEGMPAIVYDVLKQRRKERRQGGRGRWKESFFLLDSVLLRVLGLILPTDLQMYAQRRMREHLHPSVDTHVHISRDTHWCTLNRTWIFCFCHRNGMQYRIYSIWIIIDIYLFCFATIYVALYNKDQKGLSLQTNTDVKDS